MKITVFSCKSKLQHNTVIFAGFLQYFPAISAVIFYSVACTFKVNAKDFSFKLTAVDSSPVGKTTKIIGL